MSWVLGSIFKALRWDVSNHGRQCGLRGSPDTSGPRRGRLRSDRVVSMSVESWNLWNVILKIHNYVLLITLGFHSFCWPKVKCQVQAQHPKRGTTCACLDSSPRTWNAGSGTIGLTWDTLYSNTLSPLAEDFLSSCCIFQVIYCVWFPLTTCRVKLRHMKKKSFHILDRKNTACAVLHVLMHPTPFSVKCHLFFLQVLKPLVVWGRDVKRSASVSETQ